MSHRRSVIEKQRLKKLATKTPNCWCRGSWYDEDKGRYVRIYSSGRSGLPKYLRRMSNRKYRRYTGKLNHSQYKRLYDLWWILF